MAERPTTTTDAGIPAPSDEYSLTTGPTGPILLQDHYLIQKMAQFNRERVPERVVHAKGAGAHGYFECHEDLRAFTRAKVFRKGRRTDAFVRFSSVAGEQGYPDTVRDPRGFAIKLYTEEGNYDLVGNNTPIFFIRDPQKFQDFIHSQKRRSDNGMRDHAMQWDFWTLSPETAHQVTFLMTDRGTPRTYRHMNGYGSHTFTWVNEDGQAFYVKYHFKTDQGIENFTRRDAQAMTAEDPDYHRRDLWNAMERGDEASWTLEMQIMPVTEAANYRFDPFDLTKVWPHADYPPIPVGRLVLNRNPDDYFAEVEQSAFEPSNLVPGIEPSPDRMLLGRLFMSRRPSPSHRHQSTCSFPINRPIGDPELDKDVRCAARSRRSGLRRTAEAARRPDRSATPRPTCAGPTGSLVRAPQRRHPEDDDFGQARTLIDKVLGGEEVDHLVDNVVDHAGQGLSSKMQACRGLLRSIHTDVGDRVARALGTE
ncbi:MAG: catalase [Myxococcota bacterium]